MEEFFIPIITHESKYCLCERTKAFVIDEDNPAHDILKAFKLISNRNLILRGTRGRKYQLLTLEQSGNLYTYQWFVFDK